MHLPTVIVFALADAPMTIEHLQRWVRLQWPRILPEAVEATVAQLSRLNFIECRRGKWRISHEA